MIALFVCIKTQESPCDLRLGARELLHHGAVVEGEVCESYGDRPKAQGQRDGHRICYRGQT